MAAYVVVGELGTGKTLQAVAKIRDALMKGLPVATNIDLRLERLVHERKQVRLTRLPDWPVVEDFKRLGDAPGATKDPKTHGWIVLDEAAVFLNAREWAGEAGASKEEKAAAARARSQLIMWLRHARKHRWHLIILSQDLESLDAQVRRSLAQFVVQCRRLDSFTVPFLSPVTKMLGFGAIKLPQMHLGLVRLGSRMSGPPVDKWWLPDAVSLHGAYDTEQKIYGDNDGAATMLDGRSAPYLWKPRGWRELLWELLLWRWYPPSLARSRYDDARLSALGVTPSCKPHVSYAQWLARAAHAGALGGHLEVAGEAPEPAPGELLEEAA